MNLLKIGKGEVYPYLKILCLLTMISIVGMIRLSAQIDVKIEEILGFSSLGRSEEILWVNPNPVQHELTITHAEGIILTKLTILDVSGQQVYQANLTPQSTFTIMLSPGKYHFVLKTIQGFVSKQVLVLET